ncbi:uncharacterized protein LOC127589225 isoform X4 [Hippocampus zosterae]|uniref:uncharacterized protein LOC127589225 isoform X4 n=1 Tax=Hippocampus zosterae TaxID=109293 RepID=UPI00223E7A88|nr:uncharacterized protein LOC127589225 isoform X4 [Hippocampus zosterae]
MLIISNGTGKDWNTKHQCYTDMTTSSKCYVLPPIVLYNIPDVRAYVELDSGPMLAGNNYSLVCDIVNVAPVHKLTVRWLRGNKIVKTVSFSDRSSDDINMTLHNISDSFTISASGDENGQIYTCQAELNLEPGDVFLLNSSMNITVELPGISLVPDSSLVPESSPVPESNPIPESSLVPESSPVLESSPSPESSLVPESSPVPEITLTTESNPVPKSSPVPESTTMPKSGLVPESSPVPEITLTTESNPVLVAVISACALVLLVVLAVIFICLNRGKRQGQYSLKNWSDSIPLGNSRVGNSLVT